MSLTTSVTDVSSIHSSMSSDISVTTVIPTAAATISSPLPETATLTVMIGSQTLTDVARVDSTLNNAVTRTADAMLTSVATIALISAASGVAGPAMLQAVMSQSACGPAASGGVEDRSASSSYAVSPFVGNSFAMVGGNIGLVVLFLALHLVALLIARTTVGGRRNPRAAATLARFPQ
jgi:hypothetical protein